MLNKVLIKFQNPKKCKFLVFDEITDKELKEIILNDFEYSLLKIRKKEIYLSLKVFFLFILNLYYLPWNFIFHKSFNIKMLLEQFYVIYLLVYLKISKPNLILTFIDNNWYFHRLDRLYKKGKFLNIQNGLRGKISFERLLPKPPHPGSKIYISNYFCFGEYTRDIHKEYNHEIKNYKLIGSIKLLYFKNKNKNKNNDIRYPILLISQWKTVFMKKDGFLPEIGVSLKKNNSLIKNFLKQYDFQISILLRTNSESEKLFYKSYFGKYCNFIKPKNEQLYSYKIINMSELLISFNSTLCLEAYSLKKKVFFSNQTGSKLYSIPIINSCTTSKDNQNNFNRKLFQLINMKQNIYEKRTEENRNYLINTNNNFDLIQLKDEISNLID